MQEHVLSRVNLYLYLNHENSIKPGSHCCVNALFWEVILGMCDLSQSRWLLWEHCVHTHIFNLPKLDLQTKSNWSSLTGRSVDTYIERSPIPVVTPSPPPPSSPDSCPPRSPSPSPSAPFQNGWCSVPGSVSGNSDSRRSWWTPLHPATQNKWLVKTGNEHLRYLSGAGFSWRCGRKRIVKFQMAHLKSIKTDDTVPMGNITLRQDLFGFLWDQRRT